ncbi:hypothetical protein CH249_14345 [Rhodococcus sp. 05-2255-3B1]|nr:hypothetical protein CH249_14345 [Rhodococcus sp. 05-2255-3B1]OZE17351.1 hypothetical protein CH255_18300 [Rhodococcus sp. 05-2255-2A2]
MSAGPSWVARVDPKQKEFGFDRVQCWAASVSVQVPDPVFEVVLRSGRVSNSMCRPHLVPMLHARLLDLSHGRDLFPGRTQIPPLSVVLMRLLSRR